jgi:hypothetical protein
MLMLNNMIIYTSTKLAIPRKTNKELSSLNILNKYLFIFLYIQKTFYIATLIDLHCINYVIQYCLSRDSNSIHSPRINHLKLLEIFLIQRN